MPKFEFKSKVQISYTKTPILSCSIKNIHTYNIVK